MTTPDLRLRFFCRHCGYRDLRADALAAHVFEAHGIAPKTHPETIIPYEVTK